MAKDDGLVSKLVGTIVATVVTGGWAAVVAEMAKSSDKDYTSSIAIGSCAVVFATQAYIYAKKLYKSKDF